MKIWLRLLLGVGIGVLLGLFLPDRAGDTGALFSDLSAIVINIGRFFLFPLVFFSAITAADELRDESKLLSTVVSTFILAVLTTVGSVVVTVAMILLFAPERIPPILQEGQPEQIDSVSQIVGDMFPRNLFSVFAGEGTALLPVVVLALIIGAVLAYDRHVTDPVATVVDSASRIFFRLSSLVVDFIGIGLIAVSAAILFELRRTAELAIYRQLLLVLAVSAAAIVLLVYPVLLYLLRRRSRPMHWLATMVAPALQAAASGDVYFSYPTLIRVTSKDREIGRPRGATILPVATLFGRAGSAGVAAATFIVVIRSYTALEIGVGEVAWILLFATLFSLLLSRFPAAGVTVLLGTLATRYGQGMEEAYLIVFPVLPLLLRLGALVDTVTAGFILELLRERRER